MKKNLKIKDYVTKRKDLVDVEGDVKPPDIEETTRVFAGGEGRVANKDRLYITITPEIRDKVMKGISLFSAGAIATKAGSEMLEEREPANGY